jgi:hypothetical protein
VPTRTTYIRLFLLWLVTVCAIEVVTRTPGVPYNVRGLRSSSWPIVGTGLLGATWLVAFGLPAILAQVLVARRAGAFAPVYVLAHAMAVAYLLIEAAPTEAIHDIVGSPVLEWPWRWELLLRLTGLFALVSAILVVGCVVVTARPRREWILTATAIIGSSLVSLIPLSYWSVVVQACTDNIVELLIGGGTVRGWSALSLGAGAIAVAGAWLARCLAQGPSRRWLLVPLVVPTATFLAYWAWTFALTPALNKYGKTFSALQFLLSADRDNYLGDAELLTRFAVVCVAAITGIAIAQYPWMVRDTAVRRP